MSTSRIESHHGGRRVSLLVVGAGIVTALVLMVVVYRVFLTIPVTVEGAPIRVMAGAHVSDVLGRLRGKPGNLISVKTHKLLQVGKGKPGYALLDGKPAKPEDVLHAGDVVVGANGADVPETIVIRNEQMPAPVKYRGSGPLQSVVTSGSPGVREVRVGAISGEMLSYRITKPPVPQIIRRDKPGPEARVVALTFDDGPWPKQTEAILAILQRYQIKATFFEIGSQAKGRPQLSKRVADAGMALGNHTEDHLNLKRLSDTGVKNEIVQAQVSISKASGQSPRFFRPPGGNINPVVWGILDSQHMKLVNWDIDTEDWRRPPVDSIVTRVMSGVKPGAVILMHDGGGDRSHTIAALPIIIERLKAAGYGFVTLDQLASLPTKMG